MKAFTRTVALVVALATSWASLAQETLYPPWDGWDSWRNSTIQVGWDYGYETGTLNDATVVVDLVSVAGVSTTNQWCWNYQAWTAPADDYYRFTFNYNASGWASLNGASVFGDASWITMTAVLRIVPSWTTWEEGPYWYNYLRTVAATSGVPYIPLPPYEYDEDVYVTTPPIWFDEGETVSIGGGIQILPTCVSLVGFVSILGENTGQLNSVQIVRENPPNPILAVDPDPPAHVFGQQIRLEPVEWTFNVWNSGTGTLTWAVDTVSDWFEMAPTSGESNGEVDSVTVTVDTSDMELGEHTGFITITSNAGSDLGVIIIEIINLPPSANAGGPYYAEAGEVITFDASESVDIDGTIAAFRWDWENDGTWDTGWLGTPTANHSFSPNGLYRSRLQVKDNDGETSTDVCATHVGYEWEKDVVDFEGTTGWECAIALDSDGRPHISHIDAEGDMRLKYARWTGTEWLREDVAPCFYGWRATSIALDANDNPRIAYRGVHGDPHYHLCYASKTGSTWTIETVDAEHFCAYSCDLAIDESNAPHIVYTGDLGVGQSYLKYAHWNGSQWVMESIGPTNGRTGISASIALDLQDRPHVCCYDEGNARLMYARRIGGSWDIHNDLDLDGGWMSDIAVDGNGNPHICYVMGQEWTEPQELRWVHSPNGGASWNAPERVDGVPGEYDAVGCCAIAIGENTDVHISYAYGLYSSEFHCLKYATKLGSQWTDEIVDIRDSRNTSLALDAAGLPHIAYWAWDWTALHYATLAGPTNSPPVADASGPYSGNIGETIVFNASGSYDFDGTIVGYRWDWNNDGAWDTEWGPWPQASHVFGEGGTHTIVLEVEDDGGSRDTDTTTVDVPNDTQPPQIVDDSDADAFVGETFVFRATVTDNVGVAEVWVEYWYDEGDHWSHSMGQVDVDVWERSTTILDGFTTLHYIIFAEDVAGNPADTGTQDVAITDAGPDCNNNGIPDDEDIASGFSEDCQPNAIPDECDIADGTSQDCQPNGVPDECDLAVREGKLLAGDGAADDRFGYSVDISGDVAIIGAIYDDDNGSDSGAAYVFRYNGSNWVQEQKLTASDGAADDWFGLSAAISGDLAVIGAHPDVYYSGTGAAYVFRYNGSAWIEEAKLESGGGSNGDWFGHSVAILGNRVLVGAPLDSQGGTWVGAAYVFRYDDGVGWVQEQKLQASGGQGWDEFGWSVSLSGDVALIGAFGDDDKGTTSGSAYVFRYNGSSWIQEQKLLASDGAANDRFGDSVAVWGDVALIGAYGDDDNGSSSGSAYVFRYNGSNWAEEQKLTASDAAGEDQFGLQFVAISGEAALIGARGNDDNGSSSGSAYVFRYDPAAEAWFEVAKITASDAAEGDHFGFCVAISGNTAIVGAAYDDDNDTDSGSAYVFPPSDDCNSNDVPDECDIADGTSQDDNGNGIPDECEAPPVCPGDSNCDGVINWRDIDYFVAAMNDNVAAWEAMFDPGPPTCPFENNDGNGDGTVNWRDIDSLVALMNTTCP
ncbi:MAG: hypothetical protein KAY37_09535 [Phycisphaerae bacterium]|nr:hypothetical protein [Phycisphaerae bacterium]